MSATTQAGDWWQARKRGERLPEHEIPPPFCDLCGADCTYDDFSDEAGLFVCAECLETTLQSKVTQ